MKCERCGHELDNDDLFCSKCGKAVFEEYMDEDDIWEFYKSDEELKAMKMEAAAAADKDTEDSAHSVAAAAAAGYEKTDKVYVSENQREGNGSGNVDAKAADAVKADYDAGAKAADVVQADYDADSKAADTPKADYDADVKAADAVIADHNIDGSAADSENTDHEETDYKAADPVSTEDSDAEYSDADIMDSDSADTEELPFENLVSQAQKSAANKPKKEKHRGEPEKKSPIWLISGCILIVCLLIGILWGVRTMQQMDEEKKAYYAKIEPEDKTSGAQAQNTENKQDAANKDTDSGEEADKDAGKKDSGAADADKKDKDKEPEKEEKPKEKRKRRKRKRNRNILNRWMQTALTFQNSRRFPLHPLTRIPSSPPKNMITVQPALWMVTLLPPGRREKTDWAKAPASGWILTKPAKCGTWCFTWATGEVKTCGRQMPDLRP